jgi:hypothetical protein
MAPETFAEWRDHGRPAAVFFESWTRREAIGKAAGRGLTKDILSAPLGSVFGTADAVIHHYHIRTRPDLHLAIAAMAPQRLLPLTRLTSDLEPESEEVHILAGGEFRGSDIDREVQQLPWSHSAPACPGYMLLCGSESDQECQMPPTDQDTAVQRHLLVQYEQALTRIMHISKETKGQISGTARLMATLAAKALSFRDVYALPKDIGDSRSVARSETEGG